MTPSASDGAAAPPDRAALAIVAAGLLEDTAVVGTATAMLIDQWHELDEATRGQLLKMILENNAHLSWVLDAIARGVPLELLRAVPTERWTVEAD